MQTNFGVLSIDEEQAMREHILAIHDAHEQVVKTDKAKAEAEARYSAVLAQIQNEPNRRIRSCTLRYPGLTRAVERDFRQMR